MTKELLAFAVKREDDGVRFGCLEGDERYGVYLPADYLADLNQAVQAVERHIEQASLGGVPDAVRNLAGILDRLLTAHATVSYQSLMSAAIPVGEDVQESTAL